MSDRSRLKGWQILLTFLLLLTTTAGSASAQCAATCVIFYGRFTISDVKSTGILPVQRP